MKIGDKVRHDRIRSNEVATVTCFEFKEMFGGKIRTKYIAEFEDGAQFIFYGYDIDKKVHKVNGEHQITIAEFLGGIANA